MDVFGFVVAAVAALVLANVVAYLYRATGEDRSAASRPASESGQSVPEGTVRCGVCGTANDAGFQFCRRCVADLSDGSSAGTDTGFTGLGS